jgi:hypothetical protein
MKIELKKISFNERMSEETSCFVADLYINGKKVGYAENRGTGGPTDYHGNTPEDRKLIAEAEKYCKSLPKVVVKEMNFEYDQTLEHVIDDCLEEYLKEKEQKKKEKLYLRAICYGVPNSPSFRYVSWSKRTLAQIDKINLQRAYDKVKSELKAGEVIFNNNLKQLGVNL